MKLSLLNVVAILAVMFGQFCMAKPDKSSNKPVADEASSRALRSKHKDPPKKEETSLDFAHVSVGGVAVYVHGPEDYDDPSEEEAAFFTDCLLKSYTIMEGDSGYFSDFAILESIKPARRKLEGSENLERRDFAWSDYSRK